MKVEQHHRIGQAEAIRRIDVFLEDLMARQPPGGVTITSANKTWNGNRLDFSVSASRGFFGTTVAGTVLVTDDAVIVDTELPALVRSFVGEQAVRDNVARELGRLLA